jgi:hypothetical protein
MTQDNDCEDQALFPTKHCTQCRTGFTKDGKPIYPMLRKEGRYWLCPICHCSYGKHPHPDLSLDSLPLPWTWIGYYGSGQRPITTTQIEWLDEHGLTREEYMAEVFRREEKSKCP